MILKVIIFSRLFIILLLNTCFSFKADVNPPKKLEMTSGPKSSEH